MSNPASRPRLVSLLGPALALLGLVIGSADAGAEVIERRGTFAGLEITYQVVLPAAYEPSRAYPTVLVFSGGQQTLQGAARILENDWRQEAERRGYIVVSPAAPPDMIFYEGGSRIFPEFLDHVLATYRVQGKLHVAGASNGGITAFHLAARYPQYFSTVIGYPGMLDRQDMARAPLLRDLCLFMHVGDRDTWWIAQMQAQVKALEQRGATVRRFTVEKNQNHGLRSAEINLSPRLFDEIESCVR